MKVIEQPVENQNGRVSVPEALAEKTPREETAGRVKLKREKKERTWKFYVGIGFGIAAASVIISAIIGTLVLDRLGIINLSKFFNFGNDSNKDEITAFAEALPVDNAGIIEITYPMVDRTLGEPKGRYSLPSAYEEYALFNTSSSNELEEYKGSKGSNSNVNDYQGSNGDKPVGTIGIYPDYKKFLEEVEAIKAKIAAGDKAYTAPLTKVEYEVEDLYTIPDGYDLYTEDEDAKGKAKLAYIAENGTKVYMVPSMYVDKYTGVKSDICVVIAKYEGFKEQLIFVYDIYNKNASEYIGAINEETANRGR